MDEKIREFIFEKHSEIRDLQTTTYLDSNKALSKKTSGQIEEITDHKLSNSNS